MDQLYDIEDRDSRMTFAIKYATGCRLNEWPTAFRKVRDRTDDTRVIEIETNVLKNPYMKTKVIPMNIDREQELVELVRDFKDKWKQNEKHFWRTGRTVENWYEKTLKKEYVETSPHFLRHCRATHVVREWKDLGFKDQISIVQLMNYFGWHKIESARTYLRLGEMDII